MVETETYGNGDKIRKTKTPIATVEKKEVRGNVRF